MIYRVRRMAEADVEAAQALADSLASAPHWPLPAYLAALNSAQNPARITLVAEAFENNGPGIAGFAIASLLRPEAELESIAVAQNLQRQGIARLLMQSLTRELRSAGIATLFLEVRASNSAAIALYRSLGFEQSGLRRGYYEDSHSGHAEDALLFRFTLPAEF